MGADSVTPFSSIKNITANIDSTQSLEKTAQWSWSNGGSTGPVTLTYNIEKDGLLAGVVECSCYGAWYQGAPLPASSGYSAYYYPPEGSATELFAYIDTEQNLPYVGDSLIAVEAGGQLVLKAWPLSNQGSGTTTFKGTLIYLKE